MSAMLQVEGLTKHFPIRRGVLRRVAGTVQAVNDVSFTVGEGETLAVVGESGCGKSTIGRALLRLLEPTAGRVTLDGTTVTDLAPDAMRAMRRKMQIIFQDPFGSLNPRMTVAETLAEPLLLHELATPGDVQDKVGALLSTCGLQPWHAGRFPHEFSGGQRQRVGIARALATRPRLIVCDEPVSALDVSVQAQIVNLLKDLQAEFGIGYVFISHDLAVVRHMADRVAVVYLGRIVEEARADALFAHPRHPYTRSLIAAAPRPDPTQRNVSAPVEGDLPSALNPPSGCAFHPRCPLAQDRCRTERPALRQVGTSRVACHFAETSEAGDSRPEAAPSEALRRRLAILDAARAKETA
ncbi:ABC transporter ATP-binding protein [Jannaschia seohaensis]|uniref:Peptide/nickel transport system ATP-binding protein/oligopeptide transport system ATP-binding protein n=1 Tax=Jannaschia seohaensis TaxID=475081 RepID=A0A2Y9ABJ7_9RHOB|nr:dipeptide ABC transporter ATP-binding protein [Jannaschia seohaensis]PWJ20906.1 peptide/nickel transport system ATP-binding protein/oligopeptide transport system ATP-binding protein [Jannaschia seohaensis]SSA41316.1 peptide/nickel transport system ATP-binding protein/oligopeptide transport system ATP-binding protein [Jannaschia seohaensis]